MFLRWALENSHVTPGYPGEMYLVGFRAVAGLAIPSPGSRDPLTQGSQLPYDPKMVNSHVAPRYPGAMCRGTSLIRKRPTP